MTTFVDAAHTLRRITATVAVVKAAHTLRRIIATVVVVWCLRHRDTKTRRTRRVADNTVHGPVHLLGVAVKLVPHVQLVVIDHNVVVAAHTLRRITATVVAVVKAARTLRGIIISTWEHGF